MLRKLFFLILVLPFFPLGTLSSTSKEKVNIRILVTGLKASKGRLMMVLYDSKTGYKKGWKMAVKTKRIRVSGKSMVVFFKGLYADHWYGIRCFQDVNSNNKLDTGFFGVPKEPFGFSQNPKIRFGPPGWNQVRFRAKKNLHISIKLISY